MLLEILFHQFIFCVHFWSSPSSSITLITFKWKGWSFVCQLGINQTIISMQNSFLHFPFLDPRSWIKLHFLSLLSTNCNLQRHSTQLCPPHASFTELLTWIIEAKLTSTTLFLFTPFLLWLPCCLCRSTVSITLTQMSLQPTLQPMPWTGTFYTFYTFIYSSQ